MDDIVRLTVNIRGATRRRNPNIILRQNDIIPTVDSLLTIDMIRDIIKSEITKSGSLP